MYKKPNKSVKYVKQKDFNKVLQLSERIKRLLEERKYKEIEREFEVFKMQNPKIDLYSNEYIISQLMASYNRQKRKQMYIKAIEEGENSRNNNGKIKSKTVTNQLMVAYNGLAEICIRKGEYEEALEELDKVKEEAERCRDKQTKKIKDDFITTQYMVACKKSAKIYKELGQYEKAIEELKKVNEETEKRRNEESRKITNKSVLTQNTLACIEKSDIYKELGNKQKALKELNKAKEDLERWRDKQSRKITDKSVATQFKVIGIKIKELIELDLKEVIKIGQEGNEKNEILYKTRAKMLEGEVRIEDLEKLKNEKEEIGEYKYQVMLIAIQMKKGMKQEAELIIKEMLKNKDLSEKQIKEIKRLREEIKKKKAIYNIGLYDEILGIDVEKGQVYIERLKKEQKEDEKCKEKNEHIQQNKDKKPNKRNIFKESLKIKLNIIKPVKVKEKNKIVVKRKEEIQEL